MGIPTGSNPGILMSCNFKSQYFCIYVDTLQGNYTVQNVGRLVLDKEPGHHLVCINDVLFGAVPFGKKNGSLAGIGVYPYPAAAYYSPDRCEATFTTVQYQMDVHP